jgi:hypothetical protein
MGAVNIECELDGKSLEDAYKKAVDYALYEYGHNTYNGTISTTDGVIDKTDVLTQLMKEGLEESDAIREWNEKAWENTSKWEQVWGAKTADNTYILAGWAAE